MALTRKLTPEEEAEQARSLGGRIFGDVVGGLRRIGKGAEAVLLRASTLPYDVQNLYRALGGPGEGIGYESAPSQPEPPPFDFGTLEGATPRSYTPVPPGGPRAPGAFERFGERFSHYEGQNPEWAKYSREESERIRTQLGLSPLEFAGIEMLLPVPRVGPLRAAKSGDEVLARSAKAGQLLERYEKVRKLQQHLRGEVLLGETEAKALQSQVGRLEGANAYPVAPEPGIQPTPGLIPNPPERAFEQLRMLEKYRAQEPRGPREKLSVGGKPVYLGAMADEDVTHMVTSWLDDAEIKKGAPWYQDARLFVEGLVPEDRVLGVKLLAAWQASQRNASTASAWQKVMNLMQEARLGEPVPMMGKKGGKRGEALRPRKSGGLSHDDVLELLEGAEVGDDTLGLKLMDFLDSAYEQPARSIMGFDARGGAPAVIDVWIKRLLGSPDAVSLDKLAKVADESGEAATAEMLRARGAKIRKTSADRAVPTATEYEVMAEQVRRLSGQWNAVKLAGKRDWKANEVQAVLWHTALKQHGEKLMMPSEVLRAGARATIARASKGPPLEELRNSWVVASSWLGQGADYETATGRLHDVRQKLAEESATELQKIFYGREHKVPRPGAAKKGEEVNLPTIDAATGYWRDKYEPSLVIHHPSSDPRTAEAYAAAMAMTGRQKAVYLFHEEEGAADGLYFLRVAKKSREAVSRALLAQGFDGQTLVEDGVLLMDPGRTRLGRMAKEAKRLGLKPPAIVEGRMDTHFDFTTRAEAEAAYAATLERYATDFNRPEITDAVKGLKEGLIRRDPAGYAAAAAEQRRARASGALRLPGREGLGGRVREDLSRRDLRTRIEGSGGLRRDPARPEGGEAEGLTRNAERGPMRPTGNPMADVEARLKKLYAQQEGEDALGRRNHRIESEISWLERRRDALRGGGFRGELQEELTAEDVTRIKREFERQGWELSPEMVRALGIDDTPHNLSMLGLDSPGVRKASDLTARERAEGKGWKVVKEKGPNDALRRRVLKLADRLGRTDSRNPSAKYFELEDQLYQAADDYARSLGIDTQADPEGFDYDGLVQGLLREEWKKSKEKQPPLPFRPLPKGVRTQTLTPAPARGGLTSDPFRKKPVRVGGEETVEIEGARAIPFKGSSVDYPESRKADDLFSRELMTYPWKQEAVSARLGEAGARVLIAKPTQAERDIVEGVTRGYAEAWGGKRSPIVVVGGGELSVSRLAMLAQRLGERSGLTFSRTRAPMPSTLREGYPTASVLEQVTGAHSLRGLNPGDSGMTASRSRGMAFDAFGPYRPSGAMATIVRQGLPEYRTKWVLAHEVGHALMGLRDKDLSSAFLRGIIGGERWPAIYEELLENSLQTRGTDIEDFFTKNAQHSRDAWLDISRQRSGVFGGKELPYEFYVSSEQEVLAEGLAHTLRSPKSAEPAMPKFTAAIRELFGRDPELKKRAIEVAGVAGVFYLAAESLDEGGEL